MNAIKDRRITARQEQLIQHELRQGEQPLLLCGIRKVTLLNLFFFVFAVVWLSISIPAFIGSLQSVSKEWGEDANIWINLFFSVDILFSLMFVLVGIVIFLAPFFLSRRVRNTIVAITDQRLLVGSPKALSSTPLSDIKLFRLVEGPGRTGSFGVDTGAPVFAEALGFTDSSCPIYLLSNLPGIVSIERLIRSYCLPPDKVAYESIEPSIDRESLSSQTLDLVDRFKDDDEQIIWIGKPTVPNLALLLVIRALICLFVTGMAVGVMFGVIMSNKPAWLPPLVMAVVCVIVLGILLSAFHSTRKWRNITYALTNKRALVIKSFLSGKTEVISYLADRLAILKQKSRRNGGGDLILNERVYHSKDGEQVVREGLRRLRDVESVKQIIEALQSAYQHKLHQD